MLRKRHIVALVAIAASFAVFGAAPAGANAPGITGADLGKKIANFNLIMHPHSWDNLGNSCNGARIFFAMDTAPWTIQWNFDPTVNGFDIADCNATTDGGALIEQDAGVPAAIFLRVLGPVSSNLTLTCTQVVFTTANQAECLIGTENFAHSKDFTRVTQHVADTEFSEVLWTLQPSTNFKIAQVDVYECPGC
jgi:hypothetical protein